MSDIKSSKTEALEEESLVTERDIDEDFGMFQEDTYPGALRDEDQKEAINHAIPKEEHKNDTLDLDDAQPAKNWNTAAERDDLLESDAVIIASAAGLTDSTIDFADNEEDLEMDDAEEEPLENVPDADDIEEDTPIDPAAPPIEIVHGTDLLNGSDGE